MITDRARCQTDAEEPRRDAMALAAEVRGERWRRAADSGSRTAGSGDGRAGKAQAASTDDNEQGGMSGGRGAAAERNGIGDNGRGTAFSKKRTTKQAFFPSSIIFQGRHTRK